MVHTCARGGKGHKYPPPLGQNFGFIPPPLKTQVKTPIPPLSKPRSRHIPPLSELVKIFAREARGKFNVIVRLKKNCLDLENFQVKSIPPLSAKILGLSPPSQKPGPDKLSPLSQTQACTRMMRACPTVHYETEFWITILN